jgi:hypothetical protein
MTAKATNRRKHKASSVYDLPAHPAAELFPMMTDDELRDLAADIKKHGQKEPIIVLGDKVLDGRNRLAACKLAGVTPWIMNIDEERNYFLAQNNPTDYVLSANLFRRHLNGQQRREVIAKLLKEKPQQPDRQVAAKVGSTNKTVGKVRKELEGREEIPHVEARTDSKGRSQPATRNGIPKVMTTKEHAMADSRHQWLKKLGESLGWVERFIGNFDDDHLRWYTKPGEPGSFEHGITAERIEGVIAQLGRARDISFGGIHADGQAAENASRP